MLCVSGVVDVREVECLILDFMLFWGSADRQTD